MQTTERIQIDDNGRLIRRIERDRIKGNGWNKPAAHYSDQQIYAAGLDPLRPTQSGWLIPIYAQPSAPGGRITAHHWQREGITARQITDAEISAAEAAASDAAQQAAAEAAAEALRIEAYQALMDHLQPVLAEHPASEDVIPGGMYYRLPDPADPEIITAWYVRDKDHIATQFSSHDAAGHPVQRSVNLRTRESVEYNMEEIVKGLKGNQDKAKVTGNVGAARSRRNA